MAGKQKLDATVTIGSTISGAFKKNAGIVQGALGKIGDKIGDVTKRQKELDRQRDVLRRQGQSVDALDREYKELERTLGDLKRRQEAWNRAARAGAQVGKSFGNMQRELGRAARTAALAITAAGAGIFALAKSTATTGDRIAKTSRQLGISAAAFQRLSFAAERSGVSQGEFESSMRRLTVGLGEFAQTGKGPAADAFKQLGIRLDDVRNKSPEQVLGLIADRIKDINDPAQRNAILMDLMGRSGVAMATLLEGGSDALVALGVEAQNTGNVLSGRALADAEAFADELTNIGSVITGLKNTFGAELMPVVTDAMVRMRALLAENRGQVQEFARVFAGGVRDAIPVLGDVVRGLADIGRTVGTVIGQVAEMVGGWRNFGIVVGGLFAGRLIFSVAAFGVATLKLGAAVLSLSGALPALKSGFLALGAIMRANPIGLALSAIALAVGLVVANWDTLRPHLQPVIDWMVGAIVAAREKVQPVVDFIAEAPGKIADAWDILRTRLGAVLEWARAQFERLLKFVEPVTNALGAVGRFFSGGIGKNQTEGVPARRAVGGLIGRAGALVGERGPELLFGARSGFIATNRQLGALVERARGIGSGLRGALEGVQVPSPLDVARSAAGAVSSAVSGAAQGGRGGGGTTMNITINAQGMSAQQIVAELQKLQRQSLEGSLFDPPESFGQYDGGL